MINTNFTTSLLVDQTPEEVFNAINRVNEWWQGEIKGSTKNLNDEFDYQMEDIHYSKQKIVELIPNAKVVWLVTDSQLHFPNPQEWNGTKIVFEISKLNDQTEMRFTHFGLVPQFACYGDCSGAWGELIQKSLYSLITTGKGQKVF